ncbi:MAG: exodeoxyribonuclease VII large subunit [Cyclobacteriaceae bacterium]|nr:exodeoxyribonuclease VII large subunit [Cyclobacteriaceae bacterium]
MENQLSLLEFNQVIKGVLQDHLNNYYWVISEIASLQVNHSGHCYLELVQKEDQKIVAKSRATIWSSQYASISTEFEMATGESLKQGMHILSCISVNFHEVYGLSYNVVRIDPRFTLGERARNRKEIIDRLTREGLVDQNGSLDFPLVPQSVAIISSPTAAGYEDFLNQISHNPYGYAFYTKTFPAILQGNEASDSIISALNNIIDEIEYFDCVVIIRGGGSQIDLDCFDNYDLAVEIACFPIPILTGIGHQRDDTVADLVAHKKLKTPTATADFLLDHFRSYEEDIMDIYNQIGDFTRLFISKGLESLGKYPIKILKHSGSILENNKRKLDLYAEKLKNNSEKNLRIHQHQLEVIAEQIKKHDPYKILQRGYTMTTIDGKPLKKGSKITEGTVMNTESAWFTITSEVKTTKNKNNE